MADINFLIDKIALERGIGKSDFSITPLPKSGSHRRYFRLTENNGNTYIICQSDDITENRTFIKLDKYLESRGIPVPEILSVSPSDDEYFLSDLGNVDLLSLIEQFHRSTLEEEREAIGRIVKKTIENLVEMQRLPENEWDNIVGFPPLNSDLVRYDFQYAIVKLTRPLGVKYDEIRLNNDLEKLESDLLRCPASLWGLMYRDFQSRNIMVKNDIPYFIDFQSCRKGPGIYDLVSFAWQAKAKFTTEERNRLIDLYSSYLSKYCPNARKDVRENLPYWVMFRIIQTLGAYGLRGLKEGKKHFIDSIPLALANLKETMLRYGFTEKYPELYLLVEKMRTFF